MTCTRKIWMGVLIVFILSGCRTVSPDRSRSATEKDTQEALSAVAGAISGKPLSKEDLRNLEKQVRTDEEAQSAVKALSDSIQGKGPRVKYCPVTGQRYAGHLELCPEHKVELKAVE